MYKHRKFLYRCEARHGPKKSAYYASIFIPRMSLGHLRPRMITPRSIFFLVSIIGFFAVLPVNGCREHHRQKNLAYNQCSNGYMIAAAKKVGVNVNRKPTKAQMKRVESEIDRKCGHLK